MSPHSFSGRSIAGLALGIRVYRCHPDRGPFFFSADQERRADQAASLVGNDGGSHGFRASVEVVPIAYHVNLTVFPGSYWDLLSSSWPPWSSM